MSKDHFLDSAQIIRRTENHEGASARVLRYPDIKRYIFVDDVCGSGQTAIDYSQDFLNEVRQLNPRAELFYFSIFATAGGIDAVRGNSIFGNNCDAVYKLDDTYKCLSNESRYLKVLPPLIDPDVIRQMARCYGNLLCPGHGGGYEDSQMLMGFHHNTPDNTLPIIWMDKDHGAPISWTPVFRRYPKI